MSDDWGLEDGWGVDVESVELARSTIKQKWNEAIDASKKDATSYQGTPPTLPEQFVTQQAPIRNKQAQAFIEAYAEIAIKCVYRGKSKRISSLKENFEKIIVPKVEKELLNCLPQNAPPKTQPISPPIKFSFNPNDIFKLCLNREKAEAKERERERKSKTGEKRKERGYDLCKTLVVGIVLIVVGIMAKHGIRAIADRLFNYLWPAQ